jgi:hypothetical protein
VHNIFFKVNSLSIFLALEGLNTEVYLESLPPENVKMGQNQDDDISGDSANYNEADMNFDKGNTVPEEGQVKLDNFSLMKSSGYKPYLDQLGENPYSSQRTGLSSPSRQMLLTQRIESNESPVYKEDANEKKRFKFPCERSRTSLRTPLETESSQPTTRNTNAPQLSLEADKKSLQKKRKTII